MYMRRETPEASRWRSNLSTCGMKLTHESAPASRPMASTQPSLMRSVARFELLRGRGRVHQLGQELPRDHLGRRAAKPRLLRLGEIGDGDRVAGDRERAVEELVAALDLNRARGGGGRCLRRHGMLRAEDGAVSGA